MRLINSPPTLVAKMSPAPARSEAKVICRKASDSPVSLVAGLTVRGGLDLDSASGLRGSDCPVAGGVNMSRDFCGGRVAVVGKPAHAM